MKRKIAFGGLGVMCAAIGIALLLSLFGIAREYSTGVGPYVGEKDGFVAVAVLLGSLTFLGLDVSLNLFRLALRKPARSGVRAVEILVAWTLGLASLFVLIGAPGTSGVRYATRALIGAVLGAALGSLLFAHQRLHSK